MRTIAAAIMTTAGFAAVAYLARTCGDDANEQIFAILFTTLILSLATIGSADRRKQPDDKTE